METGEPDMKVPLFYQREVQTNPPIGPIEGSHVFLWLRDEPPSCTLVDRGWISIDLEREHIEKEELVWTSPPAWMPHYEVKFYYLVDISDEVLLTSDDDFLRDWALKQLAKKEQHVHAS